MNKRLLQTSLSAGHLVLLAGTIWIVVIAGSFVWNWHQVGDSMMIRVENEAQSSSSGKQRTGVAIVHVLIGSLGLVGLEIGRRLHESSVRKLRENESLVRALYESAQDAIIVMDAKGRISYWNPAASHIFGYTNDEAIGQNLHSMLAPSRYKMDYEPALLKFQHSGRGDALGKTLELKALRKSGEEFSMELSLSGVQLKDGWHAVGIIRDISERKQTEAALKENKDKYRLLAENVNDVIYTLDMNLNYTYISPSVKFLLGYEPAEMLKKSAVDVLTPFSLDIATKILSEVMELEKSKHSEIPVRRTLELELIRKDGTTMPTEENVSFIRDEEHQAVGVLGISRNITERKQAEEKIRQMAYHDSLTGLPNRKLFSDRLGIALAQAGRSQKNVAVIMLDVDNFKDINDTLGHDVGDSLLKTAAERLKAAMRKNDTVARFGGDEFVLLLPELKGIEGATRVAQKIVENFRKPFPINTHQRIVTASIGIAVYPDDGSDEAALLKNADIAMYQAKQAGRDRYQVFKKS